MLEKLNCLSEKDLCKTTNKERQCKKLNETTIRCSTNDCGSNSNSEWSTKCAHSTSYCSRDALTCEIFKIWNNKVEEVSVNNNNNNNNNWRHKFALRKHRMFMENIQKCPVSEFDWKPSDVCVNDYKCDSMDKCNCTNNGGRLTFKCSDHYCATDENVCMNFKSILNGLTTMNFKEIGIFKLNKCFIYKKM